MKYEPSLDGMRAGAVAGVVAVHVGVPLAGGGTGVEVFFALSGYLITRILLEEESRTGGFDLKRFYFRRALRLLPALVAVLIAVMLWALLIGGQVRDQAYSSLMALFYVMNFNRAFEWGPELHLGHTWSLSMEEQFYMLWPLFLVATPRSLRLKLTVALIAAVCIWRGVLLMNGASINRVYQGFDTHSEVLLIGCAMALLEPHLSERVKEAATRWIIVPIIALALDFLFMPVDQPIGQAVGLPIVGLITAWLIIAVPRSTWPRALLSLPPLVYLGRISYGIYLWHYPILSIASGYKLPLVGPLTPFVTVAVAALCYRFVEQPFLRLKDRVAPGRDRRKQVVGDAVDQPYG